VPLLDQGGGAAQYPDHYQADRGGGEPGVSPPPVAPAADLGRRA
jgi:hypothetical protein